MLALILALQAAAVQPDGRPEATNRITGLPPLGEVSPYPVTGSVALRAVGVDKKTDTLRPISVDYLGRVICAPPPHVLVRHRRRP